jgi:hypothetical protein
MNRSVSPAETNARSSFSSVRENDDGLAQTFSRSKVSSYAQVPEDVFDDSPSPSPFVEKDQPVFAPPLTKPHSRLHGFFYPADNFRGWKTIPIKGKLASRSCEDLHKLHMTWSSPASPPAKPALEKYTMGKSPLENLPNEILGSIIDLLVVELPTNGITPRNTDLVSLLRTSRTIHAATLYTLYRHITIPHSRIFRKFLTTVTEYPSLGSVTRRLDFSHFNPSTIFATASERAMTQNLTSKTLLQCLELLPNLQEFLGQEYIDDDLDAEVLWKLFTASPQLRAVDFCGCSSGPFRNGFSSIVQREWPESLPITRLSFHKCLSLPSSVFEAILPRLSRLTHLDVAGTRITDAALNAIPATARITHLNLAKCRELSPEAVVKFIAHHPAVNKSLVYLSLAADPSNHLLLGKPDVEAIVPHLPKTLRSLSLKGSRMDSSHVAILMPLMQHLEEFAVGRGLDMNDIHKLFYNEDRSPKSHALRYIDISDMDAIIGSSNDLLDIKTAPLHVIEVNERVYERAAKLKKSLQQVGWCAKEFGSRYWLVRMNADGTTTDNGARSWKNGAESWGMRKIPVAVAETGGMYGSYMFQRRL